nr:E3 ubiquitin-protein ligase PRT6-like isoform X1 [Tanacetum cinerariifolium]
MHSYQTNHQLLLLGFQSLVHEQTKKPTYTHSSYKPCYATAWKRSGFCSKYKEAKQVQPLQEDIGLVLDSHLVHWRSKLENVPQNEPSPDDTVSEPKKAADVLTSRWWGTGDASGVL